MFASRIAPKAALLAGSVQWLAEARSIASAASPSASSRPSRRLPASTAPGESSGALRSSARWNDFFTLGGHSLLALGLVAAVQRRLSRCPRAQLRLVRALRGGAPHRDLPGTHETMVQPSHVDELARVLGSILLRSTPRIGA